MCAHCGADCDFTTISALKGTTDTAGSGATAADYSYTSSSTVSYAASLVSKAAATVPAKVKIDGSSYKVTGISAKAFKGTKVKTLTVKSTKLTKKSVKNCLKGSGVKTVKVPKAKKAAYAKIFAKANSGKKVAVK